MATFPIRLFGDPVLRMQASEIENFDSTVQKLMRDLIVTLSATSNGAGLAAPQIGILKRVFAWRYEGEFGCLANPRIIASSGSAVDEEGCLSIPGIYYPVERATDITIIGLDESGKEIEVTALDYKARIFQHETDHLDGILFLDRLEPDIQKEARRTLREYLTSGVSPTQRRDVL
ncbi:MAG TPA: peptide deformylase [Actinomycetota bacterium]|nr:peptide deformylase [Actinomycetota bacterium]